MTVRIEKAGPVWTVIHARPEARNAMDPESARALHDAFIAFNEDDAASVAVFWGEGGAFCAGWDLKFAASLGDSADGRRPGDMSRYDIPANDEAPANSTQLPMAAMGPSRLDLDKPVIAAVAGPAVAGGMELAMWCDFRVMEETAYMGVYCRRWGVPLLDGGTVRLPRLVGQGRAMDLILTGRQVMADECERIGLCEYVVPDGKARQKAEELAAQIAAFPQRCVRADRRSTIDQQGLSERDGLINEWRTSQEVVAAEGVAGATRFAEGAGRHGDFGAR